MNWAYCNWITSGFFAILNNLSFWSFTEEFGYFSRVVFSFIGVYVNFNQNMNDAYYFQVEPFGEMIESSLLSLEQVV